MNTRLLIPLLLINISLAMAQHPNDDCNNAATLTVSSTTQTINFDLFQATSNYENGCNSVDIDDYVDIWYEFTMPVNGAVFINGSSGLNRFALYDSCGGNQIDCFSNQSYIENLSQNETYVLRLYRSEFHSTNTSFLSFSIETIELAVPDCSTTIPLTVNTTASTVNFDLSIESLNYEYGCDENDADTYADLWYEFSMPVDGVISIESDNKNLFALYDSCGGTQIDCFTPTGYPRIISNLSQGSTYLLRLYRREFNYDSPIDTEFVITAIQPTLPTCNNIEMISVTTTTQSVSLNLNSPIYNYEFGCDEFDVDSYADFWYEFTMPINGNLYLNPTIYNTAALFESCGGNQISCFSENGLVGNLIQGETYTLRIFRSETTPASVGAQFQIKAIDYIFNDDCSNAEMITGITSASNPVLFELEGSTLIAQEENCPGIIQENVVDAWFEFTMPYSGNLHIDTPFGIEIYDTCSGSQLFCKPKLNSSSADSVSLLDNLVENQNYLLRIFSPQDYIFDTPLQGVDLKAFPRASNDNCISTEFIPTIGSTAQNISFNSWGSLITTEIGCEESVEDDYVDVWFEFTMPNNNYLNIDSDIRNHFSIFDSCDGTMISCFYGSEQVSSLTANQDYILRVFQKRSDMFHPNQSFDIWVENTLDIENIATAKTTIDMINFNILRVKQISESAHIDIYNLLGQHIKRVNLKPSSLKDVTLDNIDNGIYMAKLTMGSLQKAKKIIIKN